MLIIVHHLILTNAKSNFLILGEGPTFRINGSFGLPEKQLSIGFIKVNTKFYLRLHYRADNRYLFVSEKEIIKFKADNKTVNFPIRFCVECISNVFSFRSILKWKCA